MALTPAHIAQFAVDGYTVLPDLLDARAAGALRVEVERLHAAGCFWDVSLDKDVEAARPNLHLMDLVARSALIRSLSISDLLLAPVRALIGEDLYYMQDQVLYKPAFRGVGTGWHQDNSYFNFTDPTRGVGIWIALHPATIANGTMQVIPGSHRDACEHVKTEGTAYLRHAAGVDGSKAVPIELAPGGALFFNNAVLHCTKDNTSPHPRAALAYHYVHASQAAGREHLVGQREVPRGAWRRCRAGCGSDGRRRPSRSCWSARRSRYPSRAEPALGLHWGRTGAAPSVERISTRARSRALANHVAPRMPRGEGL